MNLLILGGLKIKKYISDTLHSCYNMTTVKVIHSLRLYSNSLNNKQIIVLRLSSYFPRNISCGRP